MKKTAYSLFVKGIPKAQPRPRMTASGQVFNPHGADAWKEEIMAAFLSCRRSAITEPVHLSANFFLPKPKAMKEVEGMRIPYAKKPDLDNLLKAVMDAMTAVCVWHDDALVFAVDASK